MIRYISNSHSDLTRLRTSVKAESSTTASASVKEGTGPIVYVVDPDQRSAQVVMDSARSRNIQSRHFESAEQFVSEFAFDLPGCVVTEVVLPGISGIQLQERAAAIGSLLPIILVSVISDVAVAVRAMKAGAINFLAKPYDHLELWESIQAAIEQNRLHRQQQETRNELRRRLKHLTNDECRVMKLALDGEPNKAIANVLDVSLRTVDFRRSSIMRKMGAKTMVELAQLLLIAGFDPQQKLFNEHVDRSAACLLYTSDAADE